MRISAIETHSPREFLTVAKLADRTGYRRLWATEHHAPGQSASPTILAALAAGVTSRLRVGTGAIMLRYMSPSRIAADFGLLEALFPGRIDLGLIGNAVPDRQRDAQLLDGRTDEAGFAARAGRLTECLRSPRLGLGPIRGTDSPEVWVCGLSIETARVAAALGAGFAYSPFMAARSSAGVGTAAVEAYLGSYLATPSAPTPRLVITCYGACSESEDSARNMWPAALASAPSFVGTPAQCHEQLSALSHLYLDAELMIQCFAPVFAQRLAGYELLAEAFGHAAGAPDPG